MASIRKKKLLINLRNIETALLQGEIRLDELMEEVGRKEASMDKQRASLAEAQEAYDAEED